MRTEYRQQLPPLWFWQDGPMQYHFVECEIEREPDRKPEDITAAELRYFGEIPL